MADAVQSPTDTDTEAEAFLHIDPAEIIIGTNFRTDHMEFSKSIKERGVLEPVTVHRNEDGSTFCLAASAAP